MPDDTALKKAVPNTTVPNTAVPGDPARRDARALRALAHPLRWKLIDLIGREETVTATRCAQALGESVASCSYHLNILAKYGFIEQAPGGAGREKPWRLTSFEQNLSGDGLGIEGRLAARAAGEVFLDHELNRLKERLRRQDSEPPRWREAAGFGGVTTALTSDELREVTAELNGIAQRYANRVTDRSAVPRGAREVRIFFGTSVTPRPEAPKKPQGAKKPKAVDTSKDRKEARGARPVGGGGKG